MNMDERGSKKVVGCALGVKFTSWALISQFIHIERPIFGTKTGEGLIESWCDTSAPDSWSQIFLFSTFILQEQWAKKVKVLLRELAA